MNEISCDFGRELRRRRGEQGFSLIAFSKVISCSKGHLSKVERGQAIASREFAMVCDDALSANGELVALVSGGEPRGTRSSKIMDLVGLPSSPSHFVGRSEELACIANYLTGDGGGAVCAVSGMGGVGKTALALRGAWEAANSFPDGCFLFDFGEESHGDMREVLGSLLSLIGVPKERIPSRPDAMANLWRSQLSGKRLLLVLDNVRGAPDIAPLLSAELGCKFLVTSRRRLSALDDAVHLSVGVLSDVEAGALFRVIAGERAAHAADHVVRAVVEHCGRLPLAVRIAAARFRSGPTRTVTEFEEMLSDKAYRLELLDDGDRSVNAVLSVSCDGLTTEQRRVLALLALHPGPHADLRSVAALADIDLPRAALLMDTLADVYLVAYESSDHITMHDLVRQFARHRLTLLMTVEEQHSAVRRLIEHSLRVAVVADKLLTPQRYRPPVVLDDFPPRPAPFSDRAEAVAWLGSEWGCLVALCRTAAARGFYSLCWQLAFVLRDFFFLTKLWGPWIETHLAAVESARASGTRAWLAISLGNLGVAHADRGDLIMACQYFRQSLALYQDLGDEHGVVNTISNLAWTELYLGEYRKSLDGLRTALNHYRRLGNRRNAAIALRGIALLEAELELCPAAVEHAQTAREEFSALGLELDVVMSVNCAAWANFRSGDHQAAGAAYEEAVVLAESCGSRYEKARSLTGLGNIRQALGRREEAVELWAQADALYGGLEPVMLGEARVRLAS
ncbi:tetratricopeptide repeat protein [Streptomyces prunicolor]|uniref:ATP-binding protein n=1 Tax=Streptomyces prunicolor TaxID=67348 RepID=UPI00224E9815|nr:tetratricopeptide repeat protein [Streptomyces prunicolor]MCX5233835.1 tetratricopeptide repeat protein [Streptomyces prunicolor]